MMTCLLCGGGVTREAHSLDHNDPRCTSVSDPENPAEQRKLRISSEYSSLCIHELASYSAMCVPLQVGSTEHYGSIAEKTEATRVRMEVVDLEEEEEKERRMRKNINVEAARLHAVTDLVRESNYG